MGNQARTRRKAIIAGGVFTLALALTVSGASAGTEDGSFLIEAVDQTDTDIRATSGATYDLLPGSGEEEIPGPGGDVGTFAFRLKDDCTLLGIWLGDGDGVTLKNPQGEEVAEVLPDSAPGFYWVTNPTAGVWVAQGELSKIGGDDYDPAIGAYTRLDCITDVTKWEAKDPTADGTFSQDASMLFYSAAELKSVPPLPRTVRNMDGMFVSASIPTSVSSWDVSRVTSMDGMFNDSSFDSSVDLSRWDTGNTTSMVEMFSNSNFNGDISNWDTSKVENMRHMFAYNRVFNTDISKWKTGNVKSIEGMFAGARAFNQPLNSWDVSKVESFVSTFQSARVFNQPLNSWNTESAKDMSHMFNQATAFNQDLSSWKTDGVVKKDMFYGATAYTYPRL